MILLLIISLFGMADVVWGDPPACRPTAYAHITNPDHIAQMVEAGEAAHVARPEDQSQWRQRAGLTPGMARTCANMVKKAKRGRGDQ